MAKKARRTTHRSASGTKLYAVSDSLENVGDGENRSFAAKLSFSIEFMKRRV
jgi:hypothetical protein